MKAVLVIDMPEGCLCCPCYDYEYGGCQASDEHSDVWRCDVRPSWCPLKEMPNKMIPEMVIGNSYAEGIVKGWNDCLEEIEHE